MALLSEISAKFNIYVKNTHYNCVDFIHINKETLKKIFFVCMWKMKNILKIIPKVEFVVLPY